MRARLRFELTAMLALLLAGPALACSANTPSPPPCDTDACRDEITVRALRETVKLAYNFSLQGKDAGAHDVTVPCLRGGTVRVVGEATSNALQGTTDVRLTYTFTKCGVVQRDAEPRSNFDVVFAGSLRQEGVLAVSAGATTALAFRSEAISVAGSIYDPPTPLSDRTCDLELAQNGGQLGGSLCGRVVGVSF
ncbi:MAG: hypothetical protein IPG50_00540 [Myxococcales bacterium]|nr:hypothetical protein [Myxococcales bacterium]